MNKTVKTFACTALLLGAAATANAATVTYGLSNPVSGNSYGAVPMDSVSGTFVYDDVANTLTGNIAYTWNYPIQEIDMAYSADWAIDMDTGNLIASSVSCTDSNALAPDGCADQIAPPAGFDGSMSIIAGSLGSASATLKRFTGGAPVASGYNTFELTEVPVPAAAWLFGSALLGLAGVGRRKRKTA